MHFKVGCAVLSGDFNLSRIRYFRLGDTCGEGSFPSFFEEPVDLRCGASSMVDLTLHRFHFYCRFRDVIMEISNLERIFSSSFPNLSLFATSDLSLLLGYFLFFYPKDVFYFLGHGFVERTESCSLLDVSSE